MRRRHFETLRPVCPVCRTEIDTGFPLRLDRIAHEEGGHIVEGVLHCSNRNCLREYPIVDGIPLIVANIREYVANNILTIYGRRDLSDLMESMLGDCCGPGSAFDTTRQHLSSYAWDHYGDLDPNEPGGEPRPGSLLANLTVGRQLAIPVASGPVIDVGCAVGRSSFALAADSQELVLGVDLNYAMLRVAAEVLRHETVRYPRRRAGIVYDRREFPARFPNGENVDFWACDAMALPFPAPTFALATCLNVLDCAQAPRELLVSLAQALKLKGKAVLTCPYDWSAGATPLEAWLGGHSQRSPMEGSCEAVLRALLTPEGHPSSINTLALAAERDNLPWHVRLHDRSTMVYKSHLVVAERVAVKEP